MRSALDFRTANGDTNYSDADSILPVADGEAANQTIFRRPTENARYRTETLRKFTQQHTCLQEMVPILYSSIPAMGIEFDGASPTYGGTFTTDYLVCGYMAQQSAGIATFPPIRSTQATLNVGTPSNNEIIFTSVKKANQGFGPTADVNNISVEIIAGTSLTVQVKGAADYKNHIYVTISYGVTTTQQVIDAINADADANDLVTATLGGGSTGTNPAPKWGPTEWSTDYTQRFLKGGLPGILHYINSTCLANFFAASPDNLIQVGDMIGVWYDKMEEPASTGGKLQSTYENSNYTLNYTQLFNSRREPWKVPNCIPICKCINMYQLLFADGTVIDSIWPSNQALGAGYVQSIMAWTYRVNLWTCYDAPYGIKSVSGGHGNLYNAGYGNTLREIFENVDEQVYRLWGHSKVYTCTSASADNVPPGDYDGYNSIETAITALKDIGGTILLRRGTYGISTAITITKPIRIIASQWDTYVQFYASGKLTFSGSQAKQCLFENIQFSCLTNAVCFDANDSGFRDSTFRNCQTSGGSITLANAYGVKIEHCRFQDNGIASCQCLQLGTACYVTNTYLTCQAAGSLPITMGQDCILKGVDLNLASGCYGIALQNNCTLEDSFIACYFNGNPSYLLGTVGAQSGGVGAENYTCKNVTLYNMSFGATLTKSIVAFGGKNGVIEHLRILGGTSFSTQNPTVGTFTEDYALIMIWGEGTTVKNMEVAFFYTGYNTINYGLKHPMVEIFCGWFTPGDLTAGPAKPHITVEQLWIHDVHFWSTASGDIYFSLVGDAKTSHDTASYKDNAHGNNGAVHYKDCCFDMSAFSNYSSIGSRVYGLFGVPAYSIIDNCRFSLGDTGHVQAMLVHHDGQYVKIINNHFDLYFGSGCDFAAVLVYPWNNPLADRVNNVTFRGNHVYYSTYAGINQGAVCFDGQYGTTGIMGIICTDNFVIARENAYAKDSIAFSHTVFGVVRNNVCSDNITYTSVHASMLPTAGGLGSENMICGPYDGIYD